MKPNHFHEKEVSKRSKRGENNQSKMRHSYNPDSLINYFPDVLLINDDESDMRLDRYLHLRTNLPTSTIQKKIRKNEVKLKPLAHENEELDSNEMRIKKTKTLSYKVRPGDVVLVRSTDLYKEAKLVRPTRLAIKSFSENEIESIRSMIVYKDDEIIVINKPQGLATQGGPKTLKHVDGLLHALQFDYPDPPRLVHRLDKNTTGALVLGRTRSAAGKLSHLFRESTIEKMYVAIVTKFLPRNLSHTKISIPIRYGGKPSFEKVTCILDKESSLMANCKTAITYYQVIAGTGNYSLLRLYPQTGRKHQLRSHCAYVLKAPILGDDKYRLDKIDKTSTRSETSFEPMYLHLNRLVIHNWRTKEGNLTKSIEITVPLPAYFKKKSEEFFGINAEADILIE
ncbi:unnamed protein product [Rhizophagus irregularis]|nr:unnamed protein product [Rhizophagus irregularis]